MALLAGLCLLGTCRAQNITFDYQDITSIPGCNSGDSSQLTPGVPDCVLKSSLGAPLACASATCLFVRRE